MERIYKKHSTQDLLTALSNCAYGDLHEDHILTEQVLMEFIARDRSPQEVFFMLMLFELDRSLN